MIVENSNSETSDLVRTIIAPFRNVMYAEHARTAAQHDSTRLSCFGLKLMHSSMPWSRICQAGMRQRKTRGRKPIVVVRVAGTFRERAVRRGWGGFGELLAPCYMIAHGERHH